MNVASIVLTVILGLVATGTAIAKLIRVEEVVDTLRRVGVAQRWWPWLAVIELVGVAGLVGRVVEPVIGLAATIGLFLYFAGAVLAHLRVGDREIGPAAALTLLALALVITSALALEV